MTKKQIKEHNARSKAFARDAFVYGTRVGATGLLFDAGASFELWYASQPNNPSLSVSTDNRITPIPTKEYSALKS